MLAEGPAAERLGFVSEFPDILSFGSPGPESSLKHSMQQAHGPVLPSQYSNLDFVS